ncbi:MAG: iron-containing alcohol dehydrogenase [Desulfobulbaceae bacterium]|jgi:alcohol dehydrogenase class IV|nr:iron-containing alcohol dehydrogenase [Desulfobulbaceae bacterium]
MSIKNELRKFVAPEFIFGKNSRLLVSRYVQNYGGKLILLVTDPGVIAAGWGREIQTLLQESDFEVVVFDALSPNPRDYEIMNGAELYRQAGCDVIVAVGGGSPLDCAKGIGIVVSNGGSILSYEGVDQVPVPMPPLICIPTTGGTSADISQFAIITDTSEKVKRAIISKSVVPDVALVDPVTLTTMSPYLTACSGMDAMVHAIEAYVSNASSPITDVHALEAIRLIHSNLLFSVQNPDNEIFRHQIMLASLQAGLAFSNASLGCVHSMAHSLGGFLDLPHGECNALLLPHVVNYNFTVAPERFSRIGQALGLDLSGLNESESRKKMVNSIIDLRKSCGIDGGLAARGVSLSDVNQLAENAFDDPCNATNPRAPIGSDLETIYKEAF